MRCSRWRWCCSPPAVRDENGVLPTSLGPSADLIAPEDATSRMLRQAPSAPALETYQLSFWVRRDKGARVEVDYLPPAAQEARRPLPTVRGPR